MGLRSLPKAGITRRGGPLELGTLISSDFNPCSGRQFEVLQENGLGFLGSGLTDPDISLAATVALYAAYGLTKPAALNGPQFLAERVLKRPLAVVDGKLSVPEGPGLGIEVDEAKVRELSARTFRM